MTSTQTPLTEPVPGSSASPPTYAEVVFNMPVREAFTYEIPSPLQGSVQVGMRVFVPFGRRKLTGYVVALTPHRNTEAPLKSIEDLPDTEPVVPEEILNLTRWVADYYQASWGQALKAALPAGLDDPGRNVLTLSEEGLSALDHESLSEPAFRILETVRERRRVTGPQLQRRLKKQFSAYALARLKQDGLLLEETHIQRSTVNYRYEKFVRPVGETESPETLEPRLRRSPKQKAVYEFLGSAGKTATELNRAFPGCSGILKKLQDKGLVEIQVVKNHREDPGFPSAAPGGPEAPRTFTADQETVYRELVASLDRKEFRTFLLHGVTGSGKTEIYLQCIQKMLDQGRSAIMMVPEISLTPQTVSRFQNRFGNRLAVLHSGLSPTERYQEWKKIFDGRVSIVVGARSAVFAPVRNLGIIVIDEEHDGSYKQETTPRYHARDTAIVRARTRNATVLLGSATPSLESLGNALSGKYQYLSLHRRIQDRLLPVVHITDMKQEKEENRNFSILSHALKRATRARLDQGEQVFLFLNRRGTANYVFCRDCGFVFHCPRCSVTLTFHGKEQRMRCHYCNHQARTPDSCVDCRGAVIRYSGFGTQKLEDETRRLFPDARIVRLDRDTTRDRSAFDLMHERMSRGDIDILIGTQMITKGHDFPKVTLVGVVNADLSLNIPDFRSSERSFQLLTQVAGRAGRGDRPGQVIIQTVNPNHYVFDCVREHQMDGFYDREMTVRKKLHYPPFTRLAAVEIESENESLAKSAASRLHRTFRRLTGPASRVELLGPARAALYRLKNRYRWHLILRAPGYQPLQSILGRFQELRDLRARTGKVKITIDVDPVNLL